MKQTLLKKKMHIAYILQIFPKLSETFIYREIKALRASGARISVFSTWQPGINELSEESRGLLNDTFYIFPVKWAVFALRNLSILMKRPRRYYSAFSLCFSRNHKGCHDRFRTILHFFEAIYIVKEIEKSEITHLHAHFASNSTTIALMLSILTDISYSFTAHAWDIFKDKILLPEKIQAARFIVGISEYNKKYLCNQTPEMRSCKKIHVVRCGIDIGHFSTNRKSIPQNAKLKILSIGRLVEKKGIRYLIEACRMLYERGYDYSCTIIGSGPDENELAKIIEENNLADHVKLVGDVFQESIMRYFKTHDIFVLPCAVAKNQDIDGIPVVLMEAMAMELPTISTNISGVPELIQDGVSGLLTPPQNSEAIAEAIVRIARDAHFAQELGKAGRDRVIQEFEVGINNNRMLRLFKAYQ